MSSHKKIAPEPVLRAYLGLLRSALLDVRARIRYGETIDTRELHDLTDALENIPEMLWAYGGWHVEENIDHALKRYDSKWSTPDTLSLMRALERAREELGG